MAQLVFEIKNQWISRTDTFKPVAKSKNYLYAQFNFLTDEWVGVPTAIFRNKTSAYEQIIGQDGTCLVPWEVIDVEGDSEIFVSVFCGDLVTANKARVHVYDTGYGDDLESDTPPTPSVYEQILNRMAGIEEDMDNATQRAESAAESAEYAAEHYPLIMDEYWYVWDVIEHEYVDTNIKAEAHDGTSATVEVEQIVGGHRVIITDASGEHIFDVPDGRDGTDGRGIASLEKTSTSGDVDQYTMTFSDDSEPFVYYVTNGASATISTRAITNGYRLTITDKNGTRAIDVLNGAKGDPGNGIQSINKIGSYENYDYYEIRMTNGNKTSFTVTNGYSPTVSTVSLTGGHRVIITDANGSHSFDVMDGNGITNTVLNSDYTLTITFTDGTSYTTPSIRGTKGDTGNGIQSIAKTGTSGLVDTYTITYTNGQTTTFDVTNGETPTVDAGDVPYDDTETYPDGSVGDGLSSVKAEIKQSPKIKDSDATGVDLDISDENGNVLARFQNGQFQVKKLNSQYTPALNHSESVSDLDVSDESGNILLRIKDGNIITKRFDSTGMFETVVTVKKDGTGDFTTLRGAIDSITDASKEKPYRIEIYPGTYNVMDDYTYEEISTADTPDYHDGFVGPMISNGVSLVGIGCRDDIVIYGTLDENTYNSTIRGNVSTLNIAGNARLENLTVVCFKLRYCVHDDFSAPNNIEQYQRIVKNCKFDMQRSISASSDDASILPNSYGAGMAGKGMNTLFENCDFGTALGIHTISGVGMPTHHIIKNCRGYAFRPNDRNENVNSEFIVNDCNFDIIRYGHYSDDTKQVFYINGTGNVSTMLNCSATDIINIGAITRHKNTMNLPVLTMVKRDGSTYSMTTDANIACGIITNVGTEYVYIQKGGYINSNILGMSSLSMGDYITVDSSGKLTTTGATSGNAVGIVTNIDEYGIAYMKMLIGQEV